MSINTYGQSASGGQAKPRLPPSQHTLCTHQKVSDGEVAMLSSYMKAHIMTDKGSGHETLHCGHRNLMIVMAVPNV